MGFKGAARLCPSAPKFPSSASVMMGPRTTDPRLTECAPTTFEGRTRSIVIAIGSLAGNVSRSASSSRFSKCKFFAADAPADLCFLKITILSEVAGSREPMRAEFQSQLLVYGPGGFICRILYSRLRISHLADYVFPKLRSALGRRLGDRFDRHCRGYRNVYHRPASDIRLLRNWAGGIHVASIRETCGRSTKSLSARRKGHVPVSAAAGAAATAGGCHERRARRLAPDDFNGGTLSRRNDTLLRHRFRPA
jgi:hypothetical protein